MDIMQMQRLMKQMGIKAKNIDATEVIIKTSGSTIIVNNPQVVEINMKGQRSFQISGNVKELSYNEEDINLVIEKLGVDRSKATELLEKANGDVAQAIMLGKEVD